MYFRYSNPSKRRCLQSRAALLVDSIEAKSTAGVSESALNLAFPDGTKRELQKPLPGFDSIGTALQDFAEGKLIVVLDNEDRENEGDLIMAADKVCGSIACAQSLARI